MRKFQIKEWARKAGKILVLVWFTVSLFAVGAASMKRRGSHRRSSEFRDLRIGVQLVRTVNNNYKYEHRILDASASKSRSAAV